MVAVETLDLNDNAPELDRQYTTAMCDSSSIGQVSMCLSVFFDIRVFCLLDFFCSKTAI